MMNFESEKLAPLANNSILNGRYQIHHLIDLGGSSFVYIARDENGKKVIIKELIERESCLRKYGSFDVEIIPELRHFFQEKLTSFLLELERLSAINSPYFISILDYFESNNTHYLVLDFVRGIPLYAFFSQSKIHLIDEKKMKEILLDCLQALRVLQHQKWVHCDIKPNNILVDIQSQKAIFIDLGSTFQIERKSFLEVQADERDTVAISDVYSAPELVKTDDLTPVPNSSYWVGFWTDYFSLGKTFSAVLTRYKMTSPVISEIIDELTQHQPTKRCQILIDELIARSQK